MNLNNYLDYVQGKESEYSLLLGDTDQIHAYVFETSKLPEIRGASQLLRTLITDEFDSIFGEHFADASSVDRIENDANLGYRIYNDAGSCMAIVPTKKVEEFVNAITEKFVHETGDVTITFVHAPLSNLARRKGLPVSGGRISEWILESNKDELEGHMKLLRFLEYRLRMEKKKKSYFPFIESNPIVRRCDHCRKRPAVHKWGYDNGSEPEYVCSICAKKKSKGGKSGILVELAKKDKFYTSYIEKSPPDLDTLAGTSGYIGILYADGNEMGNILYGAKDLDEFGSKSQKIKDSIFESLDPLLKKFKDHKTLPFEILNMAGDDIIMILQAQYVLKFSLDLLENFETICSKKLNGDVTMSLGTAIFRAKYPVRYAFEIAKSLLKNAKQFSKQDKNKPQSSLSYLYMKNPVATFSSKEILDSYYRISNEYCLTMRPYTCDEFRLLLEVANKIREHNILTSSQINAISRSFEEKSLYSTTNFIKYQIARMKDSKRENDSKRRLFRKIIAELEKKFKLEDLDGTDGLPLWGKRRIDGNLMNATPLLDIFEILEISGGGSSE